MATQFAAVSSQGSLSAVGTASKAFLLAHPVGVAVVGGALVGYGVYRAANKWLKKPATEVTQTAPETTAA